MSRARCMIAGFLAASGLAALAPGCGSSAPEPGVPENPGPATGDPGGPGPSGPGDQPGEAEKTPGADDLRIAAIEKAVNETKAVRHQCWAYAAADNYQVSGRLILGFTFGDGDTATIDVVDDGVREPRLVGCVTELYSKYRWPAGVFASSNRIELPFSFKAPDYQYTVHADHVSERSPPMPPPASGKPATVSVKVLMDEVNTGNGAAAVSLLSVVGDLDMPLHRHARTTEVFYVLSGQGWFYSLDGDRRGVKVGPGEAVYIAPGTAHGVVHKGDEPWVLVQLFTPSGPQKRYRGSPPVDVTWVSKDEIRRRPKRFARPLVSRKTTDYIIAGGKGRVGFHFDESNTGSKAVYFGVITTTEAIAIPPHKHPGETEIVLMLEGDNVTTVDGEAYPLGPMTLLQVPPGVEHSLDSKDGAAMRVLQFYTPAGPEQRFKEVPAR